MSPYNEHPTWGESAEDAWGGVNVSKAQGIMTRDFIAGGMTWTGHDYRGEESPLGWPTVSSHFGALDSAGFPKDRFFYYRSIFQRDAPFVHVFPHWTWPTPGQAVPPIWVYTTEAEAELFVNNASLGRKPVPPFSHAAWENVAFQPGTLRVAAYAAGAATPSAEALHVTAGAPAALLLSFKDGVGAGGLVAGCGDAALVMVEVVDAAGVRVPDAAHNVTFALSPSGGSAAALRLEGTANGDPACHTNNKSPTRAAFHGLALAVLLGGDDAGAATLTASAPGLSGASLPVSVSLPPPGFSAKWCPSGPAL